MASADGISDLGGQNHKSKTDMKRKLLLAVAILGAIATFGASRLSWVANPPAENVAEYILQHRPSSPADAPWTTVKVPGTQTLVEIPEAAFGRWFRIAAANSFGQSEWTEPVKLPDKVSGLKIVLEITP